jgi:hypothetical protein
LEIGSTVGDETDTTNARTGMRFDKTERRRLSFATDEKFIRLTIIAQNIGQYL